ncbi:hypothetical protein BGZ63DRAFT_51393 [Mariannaea sp. PMI_226]|nr:hypothetical protein BGZ63DRAFT_51393 [Mariannaea sp. PMI_226]
MTYYGAVSKGCEACRSRKVKCDGGQPTCSRCERAGRQCPGYRELTTVIFRNENRRIIRRITKKQRSQAAGPIEDNTSTQGNTHLRLAPKLVNEENLKVFPSRPQQNHQLQQLNPCSSNQALITHPSIRIGRNEAVCFFRLEFSWQTVPMHFTSSRWVNHCPALLNATEALGLALLSFARGSPSLAHEAYAQYGTALQLVNGLLSTPATATLDATLAVVVLMSFFEILTSRNPISAKSWTNHASGAARILDLRGPSQLGSPLGYQLFLETRGMVLAASLVYKKPYPQILVDYTLMAMEREPPSLTYAGRMFNILGQLANLRAAIESRTVTDMSEILSAINDIESQLINWRKSLPSDWDYETVTLEGNNDAVETCCGNIRPYGGRYFVYQTAPYVACGWSYYYVGKILLGDLFLNAVRLDILEDTRGKQESLRTKCWAVRQTMNQMGSAICASIPWFLGLGPPTNELIGVGGGCLSLLPLSFAACVEGPNHPLRHDALLLFDIVSERAGIAQASLYRQMLTHAKGMVEWLDDISPRG